MKTGRWKAVRVAAIIACGMVSAGCAFVPAGPEYHYVSAHAQSADGKLFAVSLHTGRANLAMDSTDLGQQIRVIDAEGLRMLPPPKGIHTYVHGLAFIPDGNALVGIVNMARSWTTVARFWDPLRGELQGELAFGALPFASDYICCIDVSPDGSLLAVSDPGKVLEVWNPATRTLRTRLPESEPHALTTILADSRHLVTRVGDGILIFDVAENAQVARIGCPDGHLGWPGLLIAPGRKRVSASCFPRSGEEAWQLRLWDLDLQRPATVIQVPMNAGVPALSDDLAALVYPDKIEFRSLADGSLVRQIPAVTGTYKYHPDVSTFSPDGRYFAMASGTPNALRVWDVAQAKLLWEACAADAALDTVAFNRDGSRLVATLSGTTLWNAEQPYLKIFDAPTGRELFRATYSPED